jgi:hypothetical protein
VSKTIDEMIEAATIIEGELVGGDGTQAEIEGAVEKACPAWAKDDNEAALVLAAHVMDRSGDEGWEDSEDKLFALHLGDLAGDIRRYLGRERALSVAERALDIHDRYILYPVPTEYRKPHWGAPLREREGKRTATA